MAIGRWLGLASVCAVALGGCGTTVQVHARFPANNGEAAGLRKVAVASFDGPEGDYFANALEAMLASAEFDGRRYFSLVDNGARNAGVPAHETISYGRAVGAEGVYSGVMQDADFEDSPYEERSTHCVKKDDAGKCIRKETEITPCVRRSFRMEVFVSLADVRSGRVVYSTRKIADTSTNWCRGQIQPYSDSDMVDGTLNRILADIRPDIAPYNTVLKAAVIEKTDGLSEADAKLYALAVKTAGKGDIGEACRLWGDIGQANPTHVGTVYNLGVCAEANGDYVRALSQYERARSLAPKADGDIAESIDRARRLIAAQQELRRTQKKRR